MTTMYMEEPLDFSVFPTILLVTTLLRLSLNVASTRVVLLQGHTGPDAAGKVIEAFGHFLVGGNTAVGLATPLGELVLGQWEAPLRFTSVYAIDPFTAGIFASNSIMGNGFAAFPVLTGGVGVPVLSALVALAGLYWLVERLLR